MDFYFILGLGRDATTSDIKRAYRRLSRQYHPGINPGDRAAEALFAQIAEAYATLVDPGRRRAYDAGSAPVTSDVSPEPAFTGFDFSAAAHGAAAATFTELFADVLHPARGPRRAHAEHGSDLHAALTVSFVDSLRGTERTVQVTRQVACGDCGGTGQRPSLDTRCPACEGRGGLSYARGHMTFVRPCGTCAGTGRRHSVPCPRCGGHARIARAQAIAVAVPAGIVDGARLRLPRLGHAGAGGGVPGDLEVVIRVEPHAVYRRDGADVFRTLPIAVHEAVLGARVEIEYFDERVKVTVPPGTQAGQRLRVRGRGFPTVNGGAGDLVVEARLVLPSVVDERSRELIREFGRLNQEDVRKTPAGGEPGAGHGVAP